MLRIQPKLRESPFFKAVQTAVASGQKGKNPFGSAVEMAKEIGDEEATQRILELNRRAEELFTDDASDCSDRLPEAPISVDISQVSNSFPEENIKGIENMNKFVEEQNKVLTKHYEDRWREYITLEKSEFELKELIRLSSSKNTLKTGLNNLQKEGVGSLEVGTLSKFYSNHYEQIETQLEDDKIPGGDVIPFVLEHGVKMYDFLDDEAKKAEVRISELQAQIKMYEEEQENLELATVRSEAIKHPEWYWETEDDIINHRWDPDLSAADFEGEDPETWQHTWKEVEFPFGIGPTINIPGVDALKKMLNRS